MLRYLIITVFILLAAGKPTQKKSAVLNIQNVTLPDKTNNKKILYTLKNLDKNKAIMINLQQYADLKFSQFQLTITSGSTSTRCQFKYINNICVLEHSSTEVNATLLCLSESCKFSIVFSQRSVAFVNDNMDYKKKLTVPGQIFKINKRKFNTILQIYAEREQHKVLSEQITLFSNIHAFPLQQIEELDTNTAIFGLKPIRKDNDQYIYINSKSLKSDHFAASFKSHNGQISDSISIVDFAQNFGNHSNNIYSFKGKISHNLQVNLRVFSPRNSTGIPLNLKIRGKDQKEFNQNEIGQLKIKQINFQNNKFYDITYAFNQASRLKEFFEFQVQIGDVQNRSIFFQIQVKDAQIFEISIFDHIYFSAAAGQILHFTVIPQVKFKLADGDKDIQLLTDAKQKYFSNIQSCSLQKGCNIQIKSEAACPACSFKFDINDEDVMNHIIYYEVSDDTINGKVDMQEQLFFKYAMNGKESVQVVVNSINVLIFAVFDTYQRCKIPRASCHQFAINQQNPLIITNKDSQPAQLILGIFGLQKTTFKVRFIKQMNGLTISMGQKFSYLMSDDQKQVQLKLQLPLIFDELQVHFNLVSPIHSSRLIVTNGQKAETSVQSLNGYISFRNKDISSEIFTIKVEKINVYYDEYLHFTLFVTSNATSTRLDISTSHYQKYAPYEEKRFLIEYDPSEVNAINIYTENLQKNKKNMSLIIRKIKSSQDENFSKPLLSNYLVRDYQFIILEDYEECSDINCELEVAIISNSDVQLQQTLNIIKSESIISLDDSIWSVFEINQLTKTNHFYFIPRHQGKPIKILFNTDDNNLYANYRIFNKKHSINPQDWPFEHTATEQVGHIPAHQEINIDGNDTELQECWPNCVIIININDASTANQVRLTSQQVIKSYKILATNTIVQLMQNTKIDFTLRSLQERDFFITINGKFEFLTFYTYYSVGRAKLSASIVYNNKQYPLSSVSFNDFQTRIEKSSIEDEIVRKRIKVQQALLKVKVKAQTDLKMTLEYTSAIQGIRQLKQDQLTIFKLNPHEHLIYQFTPDRDFTLKLYRNQGFPIFKIFKCAEKDYFNCLDHNKKLFQSQTQQFLALQSKVKANLEKEIIVNDQKKTDISIFVEKSSLFSGEACTQCIYFIWVYCFQGQLQLTLNLRSINTQLQLKQMQSFLQKVQPGQKNRYLINMVQGKRSIIGVTPIQGSIQVLITKGKTVLYNQTLLSGQQYKQYQIDAQDQDGLQEDQKQHNGGTRSFSQSNFFKIVHITVSSVTQKTAQFSIIYNIGQSSSVYLQDGIVLKRGVSAGKQINFFYRNNNQQEHAYLTISAERNDFTEAVANLLSIKFYYYPDAGNRNVKELFVPELPPKRNENYLGNTFTAVYQLPAKYELYEVNIFGNAYATVTASINHQQLVYLPLGFDYLIKLHPKQTLNIVIDTPLQQFLEVKVQKCGQSSPRLQYTNDAHQFKQGIFEAQSIINNNNFKQYIKTKQNSNTMHFKFIANANADALFTVSAVGRNSKYISQENRYEPGGEGTVNYRIINDQVEVTFQPVLCVKKQCVEIINYFLVIAESMTKVHEELNCAGAYFVPQAPLITTDIIEINKANLDIKKNQYVYRIKMNKKQAFIGVKGVVSDSKEEIQYIPIQIRDFWGQLSNVPFSIVIYVALILALILTLVIIVSTKLARRGYKPISSED